MSQPLKHIAKKSVATFPIARPVIKTTSVRSAAQDTIFQEMANVNRVTHSMIVQKGAQSAKAQFV